jgi:hypothetical protein
MKNFEHSTALIVMGTLVVLLILVAIIDVAASVYGGGEASVSKVIRKAAMAAPVVCFALSFLIGHVFGPIENGLFASVREFFSNNLLLVSILGLILGALLWPND